MNKETQSIANDFFAQCTPILASRTLEVEIATASRVGLDGATIEKTSIDEAGELVIDMTDGRSIHAGPVVGKIGLKGLAHFDTIPQSSPEPQLYVASGKGVYGYFRNRWNQPLQIDRDETIAFFYCPSGGTAWDYSEMTFALDAYRKKGDPTFLSSKAPAFSNYPPAVEPVEGLYDEATGRFHLAEGQTTVSSQEEIFGRIVYTGCSHILIGFNLSYAVYLETATGKCLCMDVFSRATHYHDEPFAATGITKKYVRVNTYHPDSMVIDIEESDNGYEYVPYTRVNRGAREGLFITFRTIGFYRPEGSESEPKILSIGRSDRLMADEVPLVAHPEPGAFEVFVPSDNFAGMARRRINPAGKNFAGKRIVLYGDSLSADYGIRPGTYAGLVRRKFGTDDVIGYGQVGEMLGSLTNDKSDSLTDDQQIGHIVSLAPDLLILQGGASDYRHNVPLGDLRGEIENPEYVKTATGGLRYLFHHFMKNLPCHSKILFVTPSPGVNDLVGNSLGYTLPDYLDYFRIVCTEYHVPVCDLWTTVCWSTYNESREPRYTIDGVHLSPEGYDRVTDLLLSEAARYC